MVTSGRNLGAAASGNISGSVGRRGVNRHGDVVIVQKLLNRAGAAIKEDGDCGRATISAIDDYQSNWTRHSDGLVDVGGGTWRRLVEGKLKVKRHGYLLLPQTSGKGYYRYSPVDRQYGTYATVQSLIAVCAKFNATYPTVLVGIGDMSFVNGTVMSPHKTHRNGRNADIRPLRTDGKMLPISITDPAYSREHTKVLVAFLRKDANLKSILFNDSAIPGVTRWDGHDNHLHVTMKE